MLCVLNHAYNVSRIQSIKRAVFSFHASLQTGCHTNRVLHVLISEEKRSRSQPLDPLMEQSR